MIEESSGMMTCPYCGAPMQEGYIIRSSEMVGVHWLPSDKKLPFWWTVDRIHKLGGVILEKDRFYSGGKGNLTAYICFSCGKGVFSIPEEYIKK